MKVKLPKRGSKYEMKPSKECLEQASKDIDEFLKNELSSSFNGIVSFKERPLNEFDKELIKHYVSKLGI